MKKLILIIVYTLSISAAIGQDYTSWHSKYWYYRTRLRNDFMKVGLEQGCSIPMQQRGLGYEPFSTTPNYLFTNNSNSGAQAQWGDAMGELGYYIGILATEYHMLVKNNQETDSVRYELYCALQALNRMDLWAETAFSQATGQSHPALYDGFMVRDDVPINFIQNNMKTFNYFGNKGFCSKVKLNSIASSAGNDAIQTGIKPPKPNKPVEFIYAGAYISQDNWINCIVGLALVRKFVDGVNYKNLYFSDGNPPDFGQEAFSISLRVMNYFKQNPNWATAYPSGNLIGSDWGGIGAGLAFAHAEAVNKIDQKKWGHFVQPNFSSFDNWCEYNDWRTDGNWFVQVFKNTVLIPLMYAGYLGSSHASGSLGNSYTQAPLFIFPNGEQIYKFSQLYPNASNPDVSVQVGNISAVGNCEYTFRGVDTKHQLQHHLNQHQIWQPELLRVILHGEGNCHSTTLNPSYYNAAVGLMGNAPCEGPYNWIAYNNMTGTFTTYGPDSPIHWHTQTQLDHPEGRDGNGLIGEFNGIDYMFYHNLITILDGDKNGWYDDKQMVDFGRRHITTSYPTSVAAQNWGSHNLPATVKSFEYIVGNNIINSNANVTYLAGKEITLGDGFSSINSCSFTAAIQQFNCSEIMSNPLDPSANGRMTNKGKTKTVTHSNNGTIYPDMLATSFVPSNTNESTKTEENNTSSTYHPTLVHADSLISKSHTTALSNNLKAEVSPNPSTGLTKLVITKPELVKLIDVIDPMGKLVFSYSTVSFSNDIELSGMGKGVYSIIIKGIENDVLVKKVVIQ